MVACTTGQCNRTIHGGGTLPTTAELSGAQLCHLHLRLCHEPHRNAMEGMGRTQTGRWRDRELELYDPWGAPKQVFFWGGAELWPMPELEEGAVIKRVRSWILVKVQGCQISAPSLWYCTPPVRHFPKSHLAPHARMEPPLWEAAGSKSDGESPSPLLRTQRDQYQHEQTSQAQPSHRSAHLVAEQKLLSFFLCQPCSSKGYANLLHQPLSSRLSHAIYLLCF